MKKRNFLSAHYVRLGMFPEQPREELVSAIVEYIDYYRNDRPQRGLGILTPMEYHDMLMAA